MIDCHTWVEEVVIEVIQGLSWLVLVTQFFLVQTNTMYLTSIEGMAIEIYFCVAIKLHLLEVKICIQM
jgi:hypothetical protein